MIQVLTSPENAVASAEIVANRFAASVDRAAKLKLLEEVSDPNACRALSRASMRLTFSVDAEVVAPVSPSS